MNEDRRPLGLPAFSASSVDRPITPGRRPVPTVDRALFLPPPSEEPSAPAPARRPLSGGGLTFSGEGLSRLGCAGSGGPG
ncbi:hypothetical protein [Kitasatospora camelliae]|uniref:Uncharacterized protein n=1 Tax=Kitasatospora camelliae TaxID=3156397 RepID=A0AAU8K4H3_9ACTN